jgi:chemosensory pili system protein ChpA (sensor histidine kinase/response regulator)
LQQVLDWANRIDREGLPASNDPESPIQHDAATAVPTNTPVEAPALPTTTVPMLRIPATLVDNLLRLVGESVILTGQIHEQVHKTIRHTQSVQRQNRLFQQLTAELEQLVEIQNLSSPLSRPLSASGFDPLELEQYNELNTVTHRLLEVATDARELTQNVRNNLTTLDTLLVSQRRLQRENQEAVLRTRMVPVKTVVPRLQRSVRQTCRLTDKEAELQVSGTETLMDSNVLNDLVDPLMHLLRNAVDHGIERPALRKELGKDPKGRIMLTFAREGNRIVVRCQDDGAGLDWQAIRRTAEQRGLLSSEKPLEEEELSRLILLPGFSTRIDTTQTSGRGIGMDAVYSRVQEIKGSLSIESRPGEGCQIELRLPLTLISTHALLVRLGEQRFAISDRGIKQILYPGSGQIHKLGGILTYQTEDEIYELSMLAALLQLPADATSETDGVCPLLLVQDESGATRAVLVEEVLDSRDMVVKSLGKYLPKLAGIVGATILGDGSVIPVLDLPELLRTSVPGYGLPAAVERREVVQELSTRHQRCALVVDDSLSARRSLAQFIADAGFTVRTAKDGLEAIEIIDSERPDLLLVDMEMPRMNGLELTSHVRANAATRHLPVIMITSRSTDKHRREAKVAGVTVYLTKPFAEDELLEHIGQVLEQA